MKQTLTIPAAVDLHVHFREPGTNKAETIRSGSRAAKSGGYGLVCDMPNNPGNPTWTMARLEQKKRIIQKTAMIPVAVYAGAQPESDNLGELPAMAAQAIGLKLYGAPTTGNENDYTANQFSEIIRVWHQSTPDKPVMLHAGAGNLKQFIELVAGKYKHHLHVCHVHSPGQVRAVKTAKKRGLKVTCGVCPHHLIMSSHQTLSDGWFARMQPPLARQDESEELFELFAKGDIDILETDHAPHSLDSKWSAEENNPTAVHDANHQTCFGVPGIEFALPLLFYQMKRGRIGLDRIIEATSAKPAEIIGVKLKKSTVATWRMETYRVGHDYPKGRSGSGWTPYLNNLAVGRVEKVAIGDKTPRFVCRGDSV
ncbi:MAG TPA: amidohydrolase family protein [Candidatus Saccharimonadales bacterium]|nr:amidohydrolase family protein [Candidatus Saccharimonadales bacterium]